MKLLGSEKVYTLEFKESEIAAIKLCLGLLQIRDKSLQHTITTTYENHCIGSVDRTNAAKLLEEIKKSIQ